MFRILVIAATAVVSGLEANAAIYDCLVETKLDRGQSYSDANLDTYRPRVLIDMSSDDVHLSRCNISIINGGRETCDKYKADHVTFDSNVEIWKFYHFESQFNVQLFPTGAFIEDNGRGTIAFGMCREVA